MKLGLTGTNRSCNRASCGACSVLVDGTPFYSCHTLATEAAGKKILTIEGVGDEKNLHPLQRVGHTARGRRLRLLHRRMGGDREGAPRQESQSERGPSEGRSSRPHLPLLGLSEHHSRGDGFGGGVAREQDTNRTRHRIRSFRSRCRWCAITPPAADILPGDEVVEGPGKTVTKKWQGYPPENLNVLGKPLPPLPEVSIPRFTGKAQYASRVWFPDLLYVKFLTSPHPRARIKDIDTSAAEKMPGVHYILTYKNAPKLRGQCSRGAGALPEPLPQELNLQGEAVAIVVAETEDLAQDAAGAIKVDYEVLPFASTLKDTMAADAPDLGHGKGNLIRHANSPKDFPHATWADQRGDIEKGFAEADIIKEFTYRFTGGVSVPMQPSGSVAKWDGDRLTMWGMGQGIYPVRATLAAALGIDPSKIRFINKWNGSTFGAARMAAANDFIR